MAGRFTRAMTTTLLLLLPTTTLAVGLAQQLLRNPSHASFAPSTVGAVAVALAASSAAFALLRWRWQRADLMLIAAAAMLTSIGMVALAGLAMAPGPDQAFYASMLARHGLFIGGGFAALFLGANLARHVDVVARYPFTLLLAALALTGATVVLGDTVNGARLWLQLGPLRFQPSELARVLLAGFVAVYLYDRRHLVAAPWRVGPLDLPPAPYLIPLSGAVLGAAAVLAFQNDLGMAALLVLGASTTVAGVLRSRVTAGLAAVALGSAAVAAYAIVPRIRDRVTGWLDPWADPLSRGFQFVQSDYSLTAGGLLGTRNGAAAARVPEVHTDFALIGIGSQLGLLTAVAVIALSAVIILRCLINALSAPPGFAMLLAFSLSALLAIQVLLIAGGTLRVIPLTGLTFPLVSYGGTSMIVTLFALGLIVGIGAEGRAAGTTASRA